MNWRFTLHGNLAREGGYFGGVPGGSGETGGLAWTLHAVPALPQPLKRRTGKAALLKTARELCEKDGGLLLVVEEGRCVSAWQWRDAGESRTEERAAAIVAKTLAEYEPPPLDEAIDAQLRDFIDRTKASMPDMWY